MGVNVKNLQNENRKVIDSLGSFSVLEYDRDMSVAPDNAANEYFMSKMNVKRRQLTVTVNQGQSVIAQAGSMQWTAGDVAATTGLKGVGDFLGKVVKSSVTKETAIKPEYVGNGLLVLEPTYKYILLQKVEEWGDHGMVIEDGMFLASDGSVVQKIQPRTKFSSAVAGGEGFFNLRLQGTGVAALESNIPSSELIEINLDNDVLKIDGNMAIAWSGTL